MKELSFSHGYLKNASWANQKLSVYDNEDRCFTINDPEKKLYKALLKHCEPGERVIWVTSTDFTSYIPIPIWGTHELMTLLDIYQRSLCTEEPMSNFMMMWYKTINHFID